MNIAVFDSGVGGITILKELRTQFPSHDFFYFGDTANIPYGTKSPSQVKKLVIAASKKIKKMNVDALIIACNTASCVALDECREVMGEIPVYSVVEAGITTIARMLDERVQTPVVIFGTKVTVRSKIYSNFLKDILGQHVEIHEQECPLLVPMIEEGWLDHPILHQTVQEYVKSYSNLTPGIAFLACTHYPWIKPVFEKMLPKWNVLDSAPKLIEMLSKHPEFLQGSKDFHGKIVWSFSDPYTNLHSFKKDFSIET